MESSGRDFKERIIARFDDDKIIRVRFGHADALAPAEGETPEAFEARVLAELNGPPPPREYPLFWESRFPWRGKNQR